MRFYFTETLSTLLDGKDDEVVCQRKEFLWQNSGNSRSKFVKFVRCLYIVASGHDVILLTKNRLNYLETRCNDRKLIPDIVSYILFSDHHYLSAKRF